jgi:hypothetical protein
LGDVYVPDPNFKEAQRLISIAENWITHAKKIGDATALVKTTNPRRTSVLNLKFDGLQIDSMIADSPDFWGGLVMGRRFAPLGSMKWNALS